MEVDNEDDASDKVLNYMELLQKGCTEQVIAACTNQELKNKSPDHNCYKFLLSAYLIQGETDQARLLWLRLPSDARSNLDLQRLWSVGRAIIQDDYANVYTHKPNSLETLVISSYRTRTFRAISLVYKSLALAQFQAMAGLALEEEARDAVIQLGWSVTDDGFVLPKQPVVVPSKTNVDLSELSNYVSFLENV